MRFLESFYLKKIDTSQKFETEAFAYICSKAHSLIQI